MIKAPNLKLVILSLALASPLFNCGQPSSQALIDEHQDDSTAALSILTNPTVRVLQSETSEPGCVFNETDLDVNLVVNRQSSPYLPHGGGGSAVALKHGGGSGPQMSSDLNVVFMVTDSGYAQPYNGQCGQYAVEISGACKGAVLVEYGQEAAVIQPQDGSVSFFIAIDDLSNLPHELSIVPFDMTRNSM